MSAFPLARTLPATPLDFLDDANQLDPYKVLGIQFLSAKEKIREAYIARCKLHHPDLHGGQETMEWMLTQRANRMLTDSTERVSYDSARVTRNAFSATEGVVKFGFVAAQQLGSVVADATEAVGIAAARLFMAAQLLTEKSEAWALRGLQGLEALQAMQKMNEEVDSREIRIEKLKQARKDLEDEANAANVDAETPKKI